MKKTILTAAIALTLGGVTTAQALTITITEMRFGGIFAAEGTLNSDATGFMQSIDDFFNNPWVAGQQIWFDNTTNANASYTWSGTGTKDDFTNAIGDFTYDFELTKDQVAAGTFFGWNGNINIPVLTIFDCDYVAGICKGKSLPMAAGPFTGSAPKFNGTIPAVPVPAAVWLFGSGLLGLVGVARHKKTSDRVL